MVFFIFYFYLIIFSIFSSTFHSFNIQTKTKSCVNTSLFKLHLSESIILENKKNIEKNHKNKSEFKSLSQIQEVFPYFPGSKDIYMKQDELTNHLLFQPFLSYPSVSSSSNLSSATNINNKKKRKEAQELLDKNIENEENNTVLKTNFDALNYFMLLDRAELLQLNNDLIIMMANGEGEKIINMWEKSDEIFCQPMGNSNILKGYQSIVNYWKEKRPLGIIKMTNVQLFYYGDVAIVSNKLKIPVKGETPDGITFHDSVTAHCINIFHRNEKDSFSLSGMSFSSIPIDQRQREEVRSSYKLPIPIKKRSSKIGGDSLSNMLGDSMPNKLKLFQSLMKNIGKKSPSESSQVFVMPVPLNLNNLPLPFPSADLQQTPPGFSHSISFPPNFPPQGIIRSSPSDHSPSNQSFTEEKTILEDDDYDREEVEDEIKEDLNLKLKNLKKLSYNELKYITKEIITLLSFLSSKKFSENEKILLTNHLIEFFSLKKISSIIFSYLIYRIPLKSQEISSSKDFFYFYNVLSGKQKRDLDDFIFICQEYAKDLVNDEK